MLRVVKSVEASRLCCASFRRYGWKRGYSTSSGQQHDPLNILFCGADEFSIYSLRALRELQEKRPEKIASIDVVCRPDKYIGRGLKQLQKVPIKSEAAQLGLNLHQLDTFKGWSPPTPINLIVAVSFGLLVPARILNGAKYGGLNVHPSLLPDLRGPAPITHALLKRRTHTGVTLQTMHPTKFDHGIILSQSPAPGIPIPVDCTPQDLIYMLGPHGAQSLCQGIEYGLFVDPQDAKTANAATATLDHAPKITPEDRKISWNTWTADEIIFRDRVLGRLWDMKSYIRCFGTKQPKRVAFDGPWTVIPSERVLPSHSTSAEAGKVRLVRNETSKAPGLGFQTCDDMVVMPAAATIDGQKKGTGLAAFVNHLLR